MYRISDQLRLISVKEKHYVMKDDQQKILRVTIIVEDNHVIWTNMSRMVVTNEL